MRANSKKCAITRPLDASYSIIGSNVTQLGYFARAGRPEVNAGAEADCKHVLGRPVNQVEVEIVLEARRV